MVKMRLNFKEVYREYLIHKTKRTTCRLGDKKKRYEGKVLDITVGSRYKFELLYSTLVNSVVVKKFGDINKYDLKWESPDCQTPQGLKCTMFHIYKVILKKDDLVTIIHW